MKTVTCVLIDYKISMSRDQIMQIYSRMTGRGSWVGTLFKGEVEVESPAPE